MSKSSDNTPLSNHKPDPRLVTLYEEATREDDEMIEFLCPAFASIKANQTRYTDAQKLGEGSLKVVYKAYDNRAHRWVALATLKKERGFRYYDHFIHEAWLIAGLKHPNIIKVHNVNSDENDRPFFTMDLKGDISFEDLIHRDPPLQLTELLEVFSKVCDAVAYAHAQKVIHLDLKPENIQCDAFGEVLVCDWGLGQRLEGYVHHQGNGEIEELLPKLDYGDKDERILGSLGYMAPEQVISGSSKTEHTDIYALGCILHTILCGEPPLTGSKDEVLKATAESCVQPFTSKYPERNIPEGLESVTLKALALKPEDRYSSAHELKLEIQKYLAGFATKAENPSFFREASLFLNRNRIPVAISALAFAVIITISMLFIQYLGQEQLATKEERVRANRLLSEVSVLSSENAQLFEQSNLTKKELAVNLANTAQTAKNFGFYDNPSDAVTRAEELVNMAFALDPESRQASWQRIQINAVKLNFAQALNDPTFRRLKRGTVISQMMQAFPNYNFDENTRPSVKQMVAIYEKAIELKIEDNPLLERIFAYNYDVPGRRAKQEPIIKAFLNWLNPQAEELRFQFDWPTRSLRIEATDNLRLRLTIRGSSKRSILRYLAIHELVLTCGGSFSFSDLNHLGIETLDLTGCTQVIGLDRVQLPYLKRIYLRPDQIPVEDLRESIRKSREFEIIIVPEPVDS